MRSGTRICVGTRDIDVLESVQHRATRLVPGLAKLAYEDRLRRMNLPTLVYRRHRGDMIEAYKYLNGVYRVNSTQLLPRHEEKGLKTRGHSKKLMKRECRGRSERTYLE
jgi:ribonucleases P/MRP protein subunit RPP40